METSIFRKEWDYTKYRNRLLEELDGAETAAPSPENTTAQDGANPPQTPGTFPTEGTPLPDWKEIWERCKQRKAIPKKVAFREDRLVKTALLQYSARRIAKDSFAKMQAQLEGDGVLRITLRMETCWMMLCRGSEMEGVYGHFMRCLTLADEFDIFPVSDTQFELVFELQAFEKSALEE